VSELTRIVEEIYANFGRGDIAAIVDTFAEDIHFVHAGGPEIPYAKDRRGKREAAAFFADLAAAVEVTSFTPGRFFERGNEVVALGHWSGRSRPAGRAFESEWAMLWVFDGKNVKSYRAYEDTATVARAFAQ
jgi:ketosteroid isomerase-like protein